MYPQRGCGRSRLMEIISKRCLVRIKRGSRGRKQRAGKKHKSVERSKEHRGKPIRAPEGKRFVAINGCVKRFKFAHDRYFDLPPHKRAFIERQQSEIMRKYQDAGANDAGVDD
ncbi:hypothetical protein Tco_1127916 [Tanacetum coccineum]